jgi:hypothetical protein
MVPADNSFDSNRKPALGLRAEISRGEKPPFCLERADNASPLADRQVETTSEWDLFPGRCLHPSRTWLNEKTYAGVGGRYSLGRRSVKDYLRRSAGSPNR